MARRATSAPTKAAEATAADPATVAATEDAPAPIEDAKASTQAPVAETDTIPGHNWLTDGSDPVTFPGTLTMRDAPPEGAATLNAEPEQPTDATDASKNENPAASQPGGLIVRVTGPKKGRWRIGRYFTRTPVDIPLDDLSEDEKRALVRDLTLNVEVLRSEA